MRQPQRKKSGPFNRNIWVFPGFLLLAACLWLVMQLFGNQKEIAIRVGLVPKNMPLGFQMVDTPTIAVFLSGSGWSLRAWKTDQIVLLPVEGIMEQKTNQMEILPASIINHNGFISLEKVRLLHHKNLKIALAPHASKKLPVVLHYDFKPIKGMHFSKLPKSQHDSVVIFGPEKILDTLTAISTVPFDVLSGPGLSFISVPLQVPHPQISVSVTDAIEVQWELDYFVTRVFDVPISLEKLPSAYHWVLFPNIVKVSCVMPLKLAASLENPELEVFAVQPKIATSNLLALELGPEPDFFQSARLLQTTVQFQIKKQ